jgi:hypothetical protein
VPDADGSHVAILRHEHPDPGSTPTSDTGGVLRAMTIGQRCGRHADVRHPRYRATNELSGRAVADATIWMLLIRPAKMSP